MEGRKLTDATEGRPDILRGRFEFIWQVRGRAREGLKDPLELAIIAGFFLTA